MSNPNYNDLFTTAVECRSKDMADNVTKNNVLLSRLSQKDKIKEIDGGTKILEELEYGLGDVIWYSGYDTITYTPKQLFTAAEYPLKMCAVPVAITGEEMLKNAGSQRMIDLFEKRLNNAEKAMSNQMAMALYGDGTENDGKSIGGLKLLVADTPTTGTVGNINRATTGNEFWRNQAVTDTLTKENIRTKMNDLYLKCSRGVDKPDLIVADDKLYTMFEDSLTDLQRFTNPAVADGGIVSLKFKGADVLFDGGQGGACPADHMYFLNTNYLYLRPHKDRNMRAIEGNRLAINQDALYKLIGWAGNLTMSNAALQGVLVNNAE